MGIPEAVMIRKVEKIKDKVKGHAGGHQYVFKDEFQ